MTDDARLAALRRAHERSRLGLGLSHVPLALLVGVVFWIVGASWGWTLGVTGALALTLLGAGWWRTSLLHGARLGLLGVLAPLMAVTFMESAGDWISMQACMRVCLSLSVLGGLIVGALGGMRAAHSHHALPFFVGLGVTALLSGSGGCLATGVGHALGLALALPLAAAPAYLIGRMQVATTS